MEGWVKVHRKMLENPIVCKDAEHLSVWIYLLLNATHKEYAVVFAGKKIILKGGQLITGRKSISSKLKINESKVQRILKTFEIEQQIEQQTSTKNRIVSILKWSNYQESEQQKEQQVNNKRTTTEQQLNTNKNVNNVIMKECKKDNTTIFESYTQNIELIETLKSFIEFRKSIKAKMSDHAINLLLKNLNKLTESDNEKIEILNQSIVNGYKGVFPIKNNNVKMFEKTIKKSIPHYKSVNEEVSDEEFEEMLKLAKELEEA